LVAVLNGFNTRAQALRAEYMIKHQPQKIRHPVAIVARIANAQATCSQLLTADERFQDVNALAIVIWEEDLHKAVQSTISSRGVAEGGVTVHFVG
jgi:hypothetical protein